MISPRTVLPTEFTLSQSYPNPFNPTVTIQYGLRIQSRVSLKIYNILGQVVATLKDGVEPAGYKSVIWNANNFSSGVYFYRLTTGDFVQTKKMLLVK